MKRAITILGAGTCLVGALAAGAARLLAAQPATQPGWPPAGLLGSWHGSASIVVSWCKQSHLPVAITIARNGTVTGTVGDAKLRDAQVRPNRGALGRTLGLKTDYLITGRLDGAIVAAEDIKRDGVNIPLDPANGALRGGVATTGKKLGGLKTMILSAAHLQLTPARSASSKPRPDQTNPTPSATTADQYWMDLTLDPGQGRMEGKMRLRYCNNSTSPISAVRLRLDPNLDKKQTLEITAVTDLTGADLPWSYRGLKFAGWTSEKGAMDVVLPAPLTPGGKTVFSIQFHGVGSYVATNMIVLQDDPYHSLDGWYPKAMTPRGGGWSIDDDRLADYEIGVKLPEDIAVASTGRRLGKAERGDQTEWRLQAERVWGFTIYGSSSWQRHERRAGEVDLAICVPAEAESWVQRLLDATADSIEFYEKEYGPFPTRHLDITCPGAFSDRAHGSSAACNMITIFLGGQFEKQYRFLVAHEVAHQYFGAQIGFPRADIHWIPVGLGMTMDEHYAQARGLDATFGRKIMREFYFTAERMGFDTTLSQPVERAMQSPPPWSFGWNMSLAHGKAYAVCAMLRDLLGAEGYQPSFEHSSLSVPEP